MKEIKKEQFDNWVKSVEGTKKYPFGDKEKFFKLPPDEIEFKQDTVK
jgi:hypothetical protein